MGRKKLKKFAANQQAPNLVEPGKDLYDTIKGRWNQELFAQAQPLVVELACGYGEYTTGLAEVFPEKNFVGVDIKGNRLWRGSTDALDKGLGNAAFLRTRIQNLGDFFAPGEVDEIWITFPDPRPRGRDVKRRLTYPRFLQVYFDVLKPGGIIHLKTDSDILFQYTLQVLTRVAKTRDFVFTFDLYSSPWAQEHKGIKTRYETLFTQLGEQIKYLRFRLPTRPEWHEEGEEWQDLDTRP